MESYHDVIPVAPCGPQPDHAARLQPILGDDPVEHLLGIDPQPARAGADNRVVEDRREVARQLPCAKERRPVDRPAKVSQVPAVEVVQARMQRPRCRTRRIAAKTIAPRLGKRRQIALAAPFPAEPQRFIFAGRAVDQRLLLLAIADQSRRHADRAAGVEHMDHRSRISRRDAQRGMRPAGGRTAN